jgi:hypothetical protein
MVWADAYLFGDSTISGRTFMQKAPSEGEATFESLLEQRCNVITSGTVSRKKAIMDVGGFEKYNIPAEDFDLWTRMAFSGARLGYQKKILLKYRVHTKGLSGHSAQRINREINAYRRILKTLPLSPEQQKIIENQIEKLNAVLSVEKGKALLLGENFRGAIEEFKTANLYFRSVKLRAVIGMLCIAPRLLLRVFRSRRAMHLPFIETSNSTKKS